MRNLVTLTDDEWFDKFKPIPNHIDPNASFHNGENGYMFETYGEELNFVKAQEPNRIWTYCDGDNGGTYIFEGLRIVNRIGYFVTTVPFSAKNEYQVQIINDDIYVCPNCDKEWTEDDAAFQYEKFEDLEKCSDCATVEEIEELDEMEGHYLND